jgi:hypothetical protein
MHITKVEATSYGQAVILNSQTEPCVSKWWLQMVLVNHMFLFTTGILMLGCVFDLVVVGVESLLMVAAIVGDPVVLIKLGSEIILKFLRD